jgi:hypothetical protein
MDNVKHTPGPWEIANDMYGIGNMKVYGVECKQNGIRQPIANCGWDDRGESEANARLIAAAPEMLEALEDVELRCTQARIASTIGKKDQTEFLRSELERIAEHARAILAKAQPKGGNDDGR